MKEIEKIDITSCTVDDRRRILSGLEAKLSEAKAERDRILVEMRKTSAEIDKGDQRARFARVVLAREDAAAARLVTSLEAHVSEARKRLGMAETQEAAIAARLASADAGAIPHDRLFEVTTPDGRTVRHWYENADALQNALLPGYRVTAQIFGHAADGAGGFTVAVGQQEAVQAALGEMRV